MQSLGDHKGAIPYYNRAISINRTDEYAYYNRALSEAALGDLNTALPLTPKGTSDYNDTHRESQ